MADPNRKYIYDITVTSSLLLLCGNVIYVISGSFDDIHQIAVLRPL